ncbi:MAG: flagellar filament capping protein FliD [Desulfovibrionaceae bacterium]|nr:flagellar filament capping protein FliD [Desulfovibrionaceae bacterium]
MSISISGSTAMSGLSGMDTNFDTTLEQLYAVEKKQLTQLEAWRSDWQLRYDAFNDVIDQMSAAKEMLATIGSVNNFVSKNAVSSDEAVLTAVASGSAADSSHTISVSQLASNAIWCNTEVFESKTDIINPGSETVNFTFDYAGKQYTYKIPPNTTLESFVSMINNSSKNPGITISLINTGTGYVYQIAGKSTGDTNGLSVYSCNLRGMSAATAESLWSSNTIASQDETFSNPTQFTFTATLDSGVKTTVSLKGNATLEDLATALQNSAGEGLIDATANADGTLSVKRITSLTRSSSLDEDATEPSYTLQLGGAPAEALVGAESEDKITVIVTDSSNRERTFTLQGKATRQDLVNAINQSLNTSAKVGMSEKGSYSVTFENVKDISFSAPLNLSGSYTEGTASSFVSHLTSATTTVTVGQDDLTKKLNPDLADVDEPEELTYTLVTTDGDYIDITLKSDKTNKDLLAKIKEKVDELATSGLSASITDEADGKKSLTLEGIQSVYRAHGSAQDAFTTSLAGEISAQGFGENPDDGTYYLEYPPPNLKFAVTTNAGGDPLTLEVASGSTVVDIYKALKEKLEEQAPTEHMAEVLLVDADGNEVTVDENGNPSSTADVYLKFRNVQSVTSDVLQGQVVESSHWSITKASNAVYKVDNWPMTLQSTSNTINDLIDGVSLTLQGVGDAKLAVSTDITSVETSIQNFLDAVNSVILTIRDLSAVDEHKQTTTNDPNNAASENYSRSTLTAEKGGVLTGNYGVQLVKSRFMSVITSAPPGFQSMASADDMLSGDILSCLANMGIKTDSDTTSSTYGLLVIAPRSDTLQSMDEENYKDMINNHVSELVDFFVTSGTGTSTSADFRYNSSIPGITEAGIYDVTYDVDANGKISNVKIGGEDCLRNESLGGYYYTCTGGAARGLAISIDDLTEGSHTGQVRIKQGLVQTVQYFLEKELKYNNVNVNANASPDVQAAQLALKSQNGAMMTLKENYATIMENIDTSIEREQTRLSTWYDRQKKTFANLETLLRQLNDQQTQLESQLKQLNNSSK